MVAEGLVPERGSNSGGRAVTARRFSVNAPRILCSYEDGTSTLEERLTALARLRVDGYPVGLMIGPVMALEG